MNLEHKLEIARTRAEKSDAKSAISKQLKKEYAELEKYYGHNFASVKREYDGLVTNEDYYDSYAEQMERRDEYIKKCEEEIRDLIGDIEHLGHCHEEELQKAKVEDPLEKHLKSISWNLNRVANVLEKVTDKRSMAERVADGDFFYGDK